MQVKADQLRAHLDARLRDGRLAPVYAIAGDEALLSIEAQDAVRAAARRCGYDEREVLHADARFDWSQLAVAARSQSLFAARRIVELRIPGGKPGKDGGAALAAIAAEPIDDTLLIVSLPRLDKRVRESGWAAALDRGGVWVDVPRIDRGALPAWLDARLRRQEQRAERAALEFIADRVEGNLLAAHQEVMKLGLLFPPGDLAQEQVARAVLDVARFDVFALPQAMLAGDGPRVARMIEGLRAEGEAAPLVAWAVTDEIRLLARVRQELDAGKPFQQVARDQRLWGARLATMERAARRLDAEAIARLVLRCAEVDRLVKGLAVAGAGSDPWLELTDIALAVSSPRQG
ncbi:MAG TPA: DNA polymerase III subunit delta [Burkholderiaceae bacterium]|nr:DNA polymerase III subunit delta [Burkholderiaceae bacterium]